MAKKVRVFFINCPSLAAEAAAFLILAQNQAQAALQFEVEHFWIYAARDVQRTGWREWLLEVRDDGFWRSPIASLKRMYRASLEMESAPEFRHEFNNSTWEEPT